ncbi:MAG: cytochrome c3 family protein [candidate division NC10 bacterium]|nr:cytochrome c3 family protein [candidate division NC10 bacterium]
MPRRWRPLPISLLAVPFLFLADQVEAQKLPEENSCLQCHQGLGDPRVMSPAEKFPQDIHGSKGIFCQDCHGGDPASLDPQQAMSRAKKFVGKPRHQAIPALCGKCHSDADYMKRFNPTLRVDQVQEYLTSVHGKRLKQGDQKAATCISCHDVHRIRAIKDQQAWTYPVKVVDTCGRCHGDPKYMAGYKIPTDVVAKYKQSVHYEALTKKGDLSAPTCNVCHGNHGATPPGVGSVANVCGTCHSVPAEFFAKSPHQQAFASMGLAPCVTCHSNHDVVKTGDEMVGTTDKAVCVTCHQADSGGFRQAAAMRASLDGLRESLTRATAVLDQAEHAGMEISQARFELRGASDALLKARAAIHLADAAAIQKLTEEGKQITAVAHAKGLKALEDLLFRHRGLWVSVGIIVLVIVGLVLKIREIDQRRHQERAADRRST